MNLTWCRALAPAAACLAALLPAQAQQQPPQPPPPQPASPSKILYCAPARGASSRRSTAAAPTPPAPISSASSRRPPPTSRAEIDRQEAAARRTGCEQNSFFVLFSGQPATMRPAQQQDPADAGQPRPHPVRHRAAARRRRRPSAKASAAPSWWRWRRTIAAQQYQQQVAATPPRARRLVRIAVRAEVGVHARRAAADVPGMSAPSGTFRTVCVRTCDGFYYPISAAANAGRFAEDEKACRAVLPGRRGAAVRPSQSRRGHQRRRCRSAASSPIRRCRTHSATGTAFDQSCSCRQPGESWSQALEEHRGHHGRAGRHRGERAARPADVAAARRRAGQADPGSTPRAASASPSRRPRQAAASRLRPPPPPAPTTAAKPAGRRAVQARSQPQGALRSVRPSCRDADCMIS